MTKKPEQAEVEVAAVETPMHVMGRPLFDQETGAQIIGKVGQSVETQFQRAIRLGQLMCRDACKGDDKAKDVEIERALDRRDAGKAFVDAWDIRQRGSKDSTDLSRGGCAENADGMTIARLDAIKLLHGWQAHMGANDWMLVQRVCGQNFSIAQAVYEISPGYAKASLARFREALDGLIVGQAAARKCQWCRRNVPHGTPLDDVSRATKP